MVVRELFAVLVAAAVLCAAPAALAADSGDIVVVSAKGTVSFTVNGVAQAVPPGGVLVPPATLRTGRDGSVELKQGATTVSVGPETTLEFPALEKRGAPIDRIVQPHGNAFYDVGKRAGRKFRVETPYLVAVIKGTQFNVAAQADGATISLFEGLLEVRSPDDGMVVDLKAGEIASRKRGEKAISIIRMEGGKSPPSAPRQPAGGSDTGVGSPPPAAPRVEADGNGETLLAGFDVGQAPRTPEVLVPDSSATGAGVAAALDLRGGDAAIDANTSITASTGDTLGVATNAAVSLGDSVDVSLGATADVGAAAVDVGAGVDVDLGSAAIDVGATAAVDAGPVNVDLGADAVVDAGAGSIEVATNTAIDAGPLGVDVGAGAAAELGSAGIDVGAATAVDAGPVNVGLGVDAAVDASAGSVDLGVSIAGVELDLGVDLGLDDNEVGAPDTDTDSGTESTDTGTVVDVGGLLDSLLRRPGRR